MISKNPIYIKKFKWFNDSNQKQKLVLDHNERQAKQTNRMCTEQLSRRFLQNTLAVTGNNYQARCLYFYQERVRAGTLSREEAKQQTYCCLDRIG